MKHEKQLTKQVSCYFDEVDVWSWLDPNEIALWAMEHQAASAWAQICAF